MGIFSLYVLFRETSISFRCLSCLSLCWFHFVVNSVACFKPQVANNTHARLLPVHINIPKSTAKISYKTYILPPRNLKIIPSLHSLFFLENVRVTSKKTKEIWDIKNYKTLQTLYSPDVFNPKESVVMKLAGHL